ncbi:hypothetical protein PV10_01043 [Exophiala mesophila]|uniref:Amidase domain-containing protein n=1 Tax=Exophiala mesophila TaxID=212818 RepID=A0A0D1X639_EXOME|nr:uncharacterized protein PV10_01043 [Exophiala mesophila]KIV97275.1 hypothetical protein PV10_01043 [Exophiala mesophila]
MCRTRSLRMEQSEEMPAIFRLPLCQGLNIYEASVAELQEHMTSGVLKASTLTEFCLQRVQALNPYLECVIEVNPDAMTQAISLDAERAQGIVRSPLHGIPVLVKDNMATADRMQTTAGSWALLGSIVPEDAHIVKLIRAAGAVILGKSNMDEWAGMRGGAYSEGYSPRGGQCRNPYSLNRSPHGSSSGSAVAVAANIVPVSFGTETDCSVISPGMVNGVVAIKPTVGLTSRAGIIPISETQDSVGVFGRSVADAAYALDAIAGEDQNDKFTIQPERQQPGSYLRCLKDRSALKGAKFGLPMARFWDVAPVPQRQVVEQVLKLMRDAGAEIVETNMPCAEERLKPEGLWDWELHGETSPERSEITVCKVQAYYLIEGYLKKLKNTPIKTLEDIVRFNDQNSGSEGGHAGDLPAWPEGQRVFRQSVETKGIKDEIYHQALEHITKQCRGNGIDAALYRRTRVGGEPVPPDKDDHGGQDSQFDALLFCDAKAGGIQIAAQAGYPIISIPVGLDPDGMPVALTLQHSAWQEDKLIGWASAIEDLIEHHVCQGQSGASDIRGRVPPLFRNHLRKNIPVDPYYKY